MVLGSHVIITAYGFWLPNDPRGSWSDFVRSWELLRFGPATKVSTHRSVAHVPHDRERRLAAKRALRFRPVRFNGRQALCIANAFAKQVRKSGFIVVACAILPDHVHLVVLRHTYRVEQVTNLLKGAATRALRECGMHPMRDQVRVGEELPSPWATGLWKVFLFSDADVRRAVKYVEDNPQKEGKKRQNWKFVTSIDCYFARGEPVPSGRR